MRTFKVAFVFAVIAIFLAPAPLRAADPAAPVIAAYRKSSDYYREPFRPQFHFSPEVNWMNDPNGLVFYGGEYHLFYQYNPYGIAWGHMSWGHAVSSDLVHWQHLPVALYEEDGVMIFSGSAVVDWQNSSGFGENGAPPLVAIYSGHGLGKQTQNIAYSNDRGRTWTKYAGNPVLDIVESDFRDPKVFWHKPAGKWIMVVSLAVQKRIQFYGSTDLKSWTHLSDFGPAGAKEKPNWECPDLFELPIEGNPGQTKWVLEVDMGGGAVAGGSGGEYFVGQFDGNSFIRETGPADVLWVDYGRDFYAPVSWSDIPQSDGRRIWIGWMNNWQTHLLPTKPWRSAMSIPRVLQLARTDGGLRMTQSPVAELKQLRGAHRHLDGMPIAGDKPLGEYGVQGTTLEVLADFKIADGSEFGMRVRKGPGEETVIGYDAEKQLLYVDRTKSGIVDFHKSFPGRHGGPLHPADSHIQLHVFIDTSSVEVFGNDGITVITDRIFPSPKSDAVELFSRNGTTQLISLDVWQLNSVWHPPTN